jgi:proteasome lid subunit RPN8/RPN11
MLVLPASLLRRLVCYLRPRPHERATIIGGFPLPGNVHVATRFSRNLCYDEQSPVFLALEPVSYLRALQQIHREGLELQLFAHSHPGAGPPRPSTIDWDYLSGVQLKIGSKAVGLIVTVDGHASFYSPHVRFNLSLKGSGVTIIDHERHIYHVAAPVSAPLALASTAEAPEDRQSKRHAIAL